MEWTKQRNKIHCIQLHLLVISIECYDARNNEYKILPYVTTNKVTTVFWPVKVGISFVFVVILKQVQENAIYQLCFGVFFGKTVHL